MTRLVALAGLLLAGGLPALAQDSPPAREGQRLLFEEHFEDTDWEARSWYDGPHMEITDAEHIEGSGHSCLWHWAAAGDAAPAGGGARVRLEPVESLTIRFSMKHSDNWAWTGVGYHPHEFYFLTDADEEYVGPAYTHLTFYVEAVEGVPRVAIQDGANVDEARVGEDLVGTTEDRAVAGCNGDSDGYGAGDCYRNGDVHWNGKFWEDPETRLTDEPGPTCKGDWHEVCVRIGLNSVSEGVGQRDGLVQYWLDGRLLFSHDDVVFRTGAHPTMRINQFMMAPWYGPGVPHGQSIWIDDLTIHTDDPEA